LAAYAGNREEADYLAVESSQVGKLLLEMLQGSEGWEGTATALLSELERCAGIAEGKPKPKGWPGNARALSGQVKRVAPHLRKLGWECTDSREPNSSRRRLIAIRQIPGTCVHSVHSVQAIADSQGIVESARTQPDANGGQWTQTVAENPSDWTQMDDSDANSPSLSDVDDSDVGEL
jgi:hypothetical protein